MGCIHQKRNWLSSGESKSGSSKLKSDGEFLVDDDLNFFNGDWLSSGKYKSGSSKLKSDGEFLASWLNWPRIKSV